MHDDKLPVGPSADGEGKLPAHAEPRAIATGARALSIDLLEDKHAEDTDEIDLRTYWQILVKRRWLVLGVLVAALAVTLLVTLFTTPIYRASTVLQLEKDNSQIVQIGDTPLSFGGGWDPEFLQTQYELLRSRALAERVAGELDLDANALQHLSGESWLQRILGKIRPGAKAPPPQMDAKARLKAATGIVQGGLTVSPVRDSRLVKLYFDSPSPSLSARIVNALADGFIASGIERRFGASAYAGKFLEQQLQQAKTKLEESERQLIAFAQKENIVGRGEDGQSLAGQNLTALNSQLAEAQGARIRAEARWQEAQSARGAALPADMLSNSTLQALQQQRAELQGEYRKKLQVFGPKYPEIEQLKGQLDELDNQVANALANIRASVKAEYDAAASQEKLLQDKLASLRDKTLDVDSRSVQYNILKRDVDTNRQLYDALLQRYKEAGVAANMRPNNISIIDRALVPAGPYKPSLSRNLAIGLLIGLALGVLLAFALEFLDDTLKTPEDIEQRLRMPVLGIIPRLGARQSVAIAQGDPRSAFSESYRSVRTALQFSTDHGVPRVLLLTSPGGGEGKSTSALALARNFAQLGKRVLLIEGDLRNPSLHRHFAHPAAIGLSNLLAGNGTIMSAVTKGEDERLEVMLAGPLPPNPAELLAGSKLVSLLTVAAQHYDQVIIDGPPVLGIADAPLLASVAEGTLLVVHSGKTRIATAVAAAKRLLVARAHVIGALLTMYDAKAAGTYGYGYNYYAYGNTPRLAKQ